MENISVFLASSTTELKEERFELSNFIKSINDIYKEELYINLIMCENLSKVMSLTRNLVKKG